MLKWCGFGFGFVVHWLLEVEKVRSWNKKTMAAAAAVVVVVS